MKAELSGNHMTLSAENEQENRFLDVLNNNGVRVFGRRGTNSILITSPHIAGLKQIFISREQQAIIANAIGIMEAYQGIPNHDSIKIATEIGDLKQQLFTKPGTTPIYPPTAPMVGDTKRTIPNQNPKKEE